MRMILGATAMAAGVYIAARWVVGTPGMAGPMEADAAGIVVRWTTALTFVVYVIGWRHCRSIGKD